MLKTKILFVLMFCSFCGGRGAYAAFNTQSNTQPKTQENKVFSLDIIGKSSDPLRVGDRIWVKVKNLNLQEHPVGELKLKDPNGSLISMGWVITSRIPADAPTELQLEIVSLLGGERTLPDLYLASPEGTLFGKLEPLTFSVSATETPKKQEESLLYPPISLTFPLWEVLLFGLLILGALSALGYWIYKKWQKYVQSRPVPVPIGPPPKTLLAEILDRLRALVHAGYLERGDYKSFYFTLSQTLKYYLSEKYHIEAMEATAQEIFDLLEKTSASQDGQKQLETFFSEMDWIKFTDQKATLEKGKALLESIRVWVLKKEGTPK